MVSASEGQPLNTLGKSELDFPVEFRYITPIGHGQFGLKGVLRSENGKLIWYMSHGNGHGEIDAFVACNSPESETRLRLGALSYRCEGHYHVNPSDSTADMAVIDVLAEHDVSDTLIEGSRIVAALTKVIQELRKFTAGIHEDKPVTEVEIGLTYASNYTASKTERLVIEQ